MKQRYHINLFWSEEDAAWIADFPDLRYCSAFGDTPEAALAEARIALEGWTEVMEEDNKPMPEPRYRPAKAA